MSLHVHAVSRFLCIHILDDRNDIHRNCNGGIVAIVTAGATAEDMGDKQPVDYSAEYAVYVAQHDKHTTWTRGRIPLMKGMLCLKSYNHKNTSSHPKSSGVISPSTADYIDRRLGKLGAPAIDWQSARGKVSWFNCRPPKNAKKPLFPYSKKKYNPCSPHAAFTNVAGRLSGVSRNNPWEPAAAQPTLEHATALHNVTISHPEAPRRLAVLQNHIPSLQPHAVVRPSTNFSTHDFYLKRKITKEREDLNKWVEVRRINNLPSTFEKGSIVTLKGIGKCKVNDVFRALGYRDFVALVGKDMKGLGIPASLDSVDHKTRMAWFFNPVNTGLRRIDLDNHALVLFTLEFPTEIFKPDLHFTPLFHP